MSINVIHQISKVGSPFWIDVTEAHYNSAGLESEAFMRRKLYVEAPEQQAEPVAARYDFDGYGYRYIDNGHGSDWETRFPDAEMLYTAPPPSDRPQAPITTERIRELESQAYAYGQRPVYTKNLLGDEKVAYETTREFNPLVFARILEHELAELWGVKLGGASKEAKK